MTLVATVCLLMLLGCLAGCLVLLFRGPTSFDRLLAFDLVGVFTALCTALLAFIFEAWYYLEIAMGLAVLAVVATVAVAHLIERERIF